MRDHPLVQLTLARMREFYREPEAIFWVFGFPIVLAFALGIAFRNRGPGELRVAVLRGPGDSALAAALRAAPGLAVTVLDSGEARLQLRTGRVALGVTAGDPIVYRYDSTRTESRLARLEVDAAVQRAHGRADPAVVRDERVTEPGSRYIDFLIPGLLGMNLMGSGLWGVGFSVVQARTKKLLKRYMATPMRKSHYLLSFVLSRRMFHVGVRGSFVALGFITTLGALSFAGLGMLVASRARTIEAVSGLMNLVMLPMWILSGTFFSYARFPDAMQPFVKALPLTALNDALHRVRKAGVGEERAREDPHRQHHQIHQSRNGFDRAGAARDQHAQAGEGERAERGDEPERYKRPAHADVEHPPAEADQRRDLEKQEHQPRQDERQEVVALAHRRRHVALQQLLGARLHDREAHPPQAASHEVHAEEAGDEEIDVARPRLRDALVAHHRGICPTVRALHRRVHLEAREAALGAGRVVAVHDRITGRHAEGDATGAKLEPRLPRIEHGDGEARRCAQRRRERAVSRPPQHRHPQLARPPVAERNAEREGEHDGNPEHPEDRLRLAVELAHPGEGELPQRVITHRAAACR